VHYVTEGELRALHRKFVTPTFEITNSLPIPYHTYRRADATSLKPGEVVPLTIDLLPTSYQFKQGHRIRVSLAGADRDHFQILEGPPPLWEVWHTPDRSSRIELPVVP